MMMEAHTSRGVALTLRKDHAAASRTRTHAHLVEKAHLRFDFVADFSCSAAATAG